MGLLAGCDKDDNQTPVTTPEEDLEITQAAGDSATIITKLNAFREHAGSPVNTTPGATKGRREINWDAVPAEVTNTNTFPADFFNTIDPAAAAGRKRGLLYIPANATLRVSDNNFADIDPAFATQFKAFSKAKTFSPSGTNISEIKFQLAGQAKDAYISSFGIVFLDVDNAQATIVEAYEGNKLIGKATATPSDKKYSFVGIHFHKSKITRVKITSGNTALKTGVTDGATQDVVVIDDLIYDEPKAY
ncbi:hypothetical protein GCM10023149_25250 [Mucilaginibacter gynuensis]|uniref:Lipoprotein n=2 Tax=Mucilaginibacter gynuensis TaxID=1302236 RepID=A0ABP8GGF8_9SPHI